MSGSDPSLFRGPANLQRGLEHVGGQLSLTTRALHFQPHAVNLQRAPEEIPLSSVQRVVPEWTKVFGFLPLMNNTMAVYLMDGSARRFVVNGRAEWIGHIDRARRP